MAQTPDGGAAYNGGPAFPQGSLDAQNGYAPITAAAHCGMSLRDHFAAKAIDVAWAAEHLHPTGGGSAMNATYDGVAARAYFMADAMLRARTAQSHAEHGAYNCAPGTKAQRMPDGAAQSPADTMRAHLSTFGRGATEEGR